MWLIFESKYLSKPLSSSFFYCEVVQRCWKFKSLLFKYRCKCAGMCGSSSLIETAFWLFWKIFSFFFFFVFSISFLFSFFSKLWIYIQKKKKKPFKICLHVKTQREWIEKVSQQLNNRGKRLLEVLVHLSFEKFTKIVQVFINFIFCFPSYFID